MNVQRRSEVKSEAKVQQMIERLLEQQTFCERSRLPSIRVLARRYNVSFSTISKVLKNLQKEGKLTVVERSGVYVGTTPTKPKDCNTKKWQRIRLALEKDIFHNVYFSGSMPSISTLCSRYGVSFRVMKKCITELIDDNIIAEHKRGFLVTRYSVLPKYSSILFIGPGYQNGKMVMLNERFREFYNVIENECIKGKINLNKKGLRPSEPEETLTSIRRSDDFIGYIFWSNGLERSLLNKFLLMLVEVKRPIVIIDEIGDYSLPPSVSQSNLIKVLQIAGRVAGRDCVRLILDHGHKKIAYISPFHEQLWSRRRCQGIAEVMEETGVEENLIECTVTNLDTMQVPLDSNFKNILHCIREQAKKIPVRSSTRFEPERAQIIYGTEMLENTEKIRYLFKPLFDKMLFNRQASAWVIANDQTATIAMDYLEECGVKVPAEISLISFDDTELAYQYGLTSYNFAFDRMANCAFSFILQPNSRYFSSFGTVSEFEGMIMERESSGKTMKNLW